MNEIQFELQSIIDNFSYNKKHIIVLEAGCGSLSRFNFGQNVEIVGIDISEKQLESNSALDKKILGDIQYYEFEPELFDIIICWNVLEHLEKPKLAMKNFVKAVKNNGLVILSLPNVFSLKGLITKFTPHYFHLFVYKNIYGLRNAGQNDIGPFRTHLRFSTSAVGIKKFAYKNGFSIEYFSGSDVLDAHSWVGQQLKGSNIVYIVFRFLTIFLKIITFGKLGDSEFVIVLRKVFIRRAYEDLRCPLNHPFWHIS